MKKPETERALLEMLEMEKLNLEAQKLLGNDFECLMIKHRMADLRIASLIASGDLDSLSRLTLKP